MRGEEHGDAFGFVQMLDVGPQLITALRVESKRGLVEKQDLRGVQEPPRNLESPFHPAGKRFHEPLAAIPQLKQFQQAFDALDSRSPRNVIEHAVQLEVLVGRQVAVEARVLKYDPEPPPHVVWMLTRIDAVERNRPARRRQQRGQHLDGRRLAGAVGPEEREDLPFGNVERDVIDGFHLAERLDQIMNVNHAAAPQAERNTNTAAGEPVKLTTWRWYAPAGRQLPSGRPISQ